MTNIYYEYTFYFYLDIRTHLKYESIRCFILLSTIMIDDDFQIQKGQKGNMND